MTKCIMFIAAAAMALTTSTIVRADAVGSGTVASSHLFVPTVTTSSTGGNGTYNAPNGVTFQTTGTGAFTGAANGFGTLNGTLTFSEARGTTLTESDPSFFTFSDGQGGDFVFDVASVLTRSFLMDSQATNGTLYLLGSVYEVYDLTSNIVERTATAASLTLSFNSTGGSAYSSSATLAVPPVTVTPEPSSLVLLGTGLVGAASTLVRRRRAARA